MLGSNFGRKESKWEIQNSFKAEVLSNFQYWEFSARKHWLFGLVHKMAHQADESSNFPSFDAYFETIQSRKRLPRSLQESLTSAFAQIPVSSFPDVTGGEVIEIPADWFVLDAVRILAEHNIMAAPVRNPEAGTETDWKERYLGIIDYSAIILWVLGHAELAAVALSIGSAAAVGVGAGAVGALGAVAAGATVVGVSTIAAGAALAGGVAAEKSFSKDAATAADHFGEDFYKLLLQEEPFKSTMVKSIVEPYHWSPFLPVAPGSSMLTVLLLLSKYRLRHVPVVEVGKAYIKNFITQSAILHGLQQCKGRDWFDCIAARPLSDLGLPFVSRDEVVKIKSDELILEAFKRMRDNQIGGLPVIDESNKKIVGSISIRDIRFLLLRPEIFSSFRHLTVMDFTKAKFSGSSVLGNSSGASPVTCAPDASLGSVIESLVSRCTHRIYVVESDEVVGIVTLRDIISCFIYEPPGYFDNYFGTAIKEMLKR